MKPYGGAPTPEMTAWACSIVASGAAIGYSARAHFGHMTIEARVERHTWTIRNGVKVQGNYRGVTLYDVTEEASE